MAKPRIENLVGSAGLDPLTKVEHETQRPNLLNLFCEAK